MRSAAEMVNPTLAKHLLEIAEELEELADIIERLRFGNDQAAPLKSGLPAISLGVYCKYTRRNNDFVRGILAKENLAFEPSARSE